jgi:hypothetical protein
VISLGRVCETKLARSAQIEGWKNANDYPSDIALRQGRFTSDRYVAEDPPRLWGWVSFPEGFHAPKIIELARLQAWTLKPAIRPAPAQPR